MSITYRMTSEVYDEAPSVNSFTTEQKNAAKTIVSNWLTANGNKTYDEIENHLLVTLSLGSSQGATGNDVKMILDEMLVAETLQASYRDDGLFLEPSE